MLFRSPQGLSKKFPLLTTLIDAARATGRCVILDGGRLACEAALSSDLAIGLGASSTPSLEAALAGIKAITFNADRWKEHPMYKEGRERIIFDDFDHLAHVIKDFEANRQASDFGDYSFVLNDVDPFRDGKARERAGRYIKAIRDSFLDGRNKKQALESANEFYRACYGFDKVVENATAEVLN